MIWRDLDTDGQADAGELQGLGASGVVSIDLSPKEVSWWQAGNEVRLESTAVTQTGESIVVADVWFQVQETPDLLIAPADASKFSKETGGDD